MLLLFAHVLQWDSSARVRAATVAVPTPSLAAVATTAAAADNILTYVPSMLSAHVPLANRLLPKSLATSCNHCHCCCSRATNTNCTPPVVLAAALCQEGSCFSPQCRRKTWC
eukprot:9815-Heterococcus_DN1.PRE.3